MSRKKSDDLPGGNMNGRRTRRDLDLGRLEHGTGLSCPQEHLAEPIEELVPDGLLFRLIRAGPRYSVENGIFGPFRLLRP